MFEGKRFAYYVLAMGIVAVVLSIIIDPLRGYNLYFHWSQIVVLIGGIAATAFGAYLAFVRPQT